MSIAEATNQSLGDLEIPHIQASLERAAAQGDLKACYILGRALSGLNCGLLVWQRLVEGTNLRKGSALLLRAADAGNAEAWLHLYRISSDYKCSVANPQMARFCLEKSALAGDTEAQRKLGALMLRAATTLADTEAAITWLHQAAAKDDVHAVALLHSLVLPLPGDDATAEAAIERVREDDPWVALRMALARHYGLTKLEALCVDPADGLRPWGLVVGRNPFISQIRLSAARAMRLACGDGHMDDLGDRGGRGGGCDPARAVFSAGANQDHYRHADVDGAGGDAPALGLRSRRHRARYSAEESRRAAGRVQ